MNVVEALQCLGASRVIWIDDEFNQKPINLAKMLSQYIEIARDCEFPEQDLRDLIDNAETFRDTVEDDLATYFDNNKEVAERVQREFLLKLAEVRSSQKELAKGSIERICELLKIKRTDRWSFDGVDAKLLGLCKDSADEKILYIVDLNDAVSKNEDRGLEVLLHLDALKSRGTAFLLTRETDVAGEATKEADLRLKLKSKSETRADLKIPTCVIAKERLLDQADDEVVQEALRVAIKRAGLRRSIHEVLWKAEIAMKESFFNAADSLTQISPESLEAFVVQKGFREGVSELHVVERALTAHVARDIRKLFGTDTSVIESAERMRSLREIRLMEPVTLPEENLERFRKAEVWEDPELINVSLSPIACGDVFELHSLEEPNADPTLKFLLIGQPCDVALRSNGKRDQDTAVFVPLKVKAPGAPAVDPLKKPSLPFVLDRIQYACDFRGATSVRLGILDLASFRKDGLVRLDESHSADRNLLPGQAAVYAARVKAADKYLKQPAGKRGLAEAAALDPKLVLTFDTDKVYSLVGRGVLRTAPHADGGADPSALPRRLTWKLRRCGRIRMPYAAAIQESYFNIMNRRAFEMDYMDVSVTEAAEQQSPDAGVQQPFEGNVEGST
jgi:plasmid maintenance system antidote protein VapI